MSYPIQECWIFDLLYLADGGLGMVDLLNVCRDLEVVEFPDCLVVIYAKRQPAQTHACVFPDNGVRCEFERRLAGVWTFVSYAKPSPMLVSLVLLDLKHGRGGASNNWWRGLLND